MRKAIAMLAVIFATLAFFGLMAKHDHNLNNYWQGAPNATHNVMQDDCREFIKSEDFKREIAAIDAQTNIRTVRVVTSEDIANGAKW